MKETAAISVKLTEDRKKQLEDYCRRTGQGVASLVRRLVYQELDGQV